MHVQSYTFNLTDSPLHLDKMYPPYPHYLRYKDLLQGRERRIYQLAFDSIWQHWPLTPTPPPLLQPFWRSARRSIILLPSYLGCTERCRNHLQASGCQHCRKCDLFQAVVLTKTDARNWGAWLEESLVWMQSMRKSQGAMWPPNRPDTCGKPWPGHLCHIL